MGQVNRFKHHPVRSGQVLSATTGHNQVLPTMAGNDQALSTMISKSPKLLIIAPQKRPCPKLEGAGHNDSANIEMLLSTVAMQFATLFTVPVFRHTYSV